jgi:hypothetical protein
MQTVTRLRWIAIVLTLAACVGQAHADSWLDFSQATNRVTITSSNFNSATVLRRVIVTCPEDGRLVATAEAGFGYSVAAPPDRAWVRYSIAKDATAPFGIDPNHYRNLQDDVEENPTSKPGGMVRIDACRRGEEVTYVFLGQRVQTVSAYAWQPRLVVVFYNTGL